MSNEKDFLGEFIKKESTQEQNITQNNEDKNIQYFGDNVRQKVDYIKTSLEEQYHNIDINYLPYNKFYPIGTKISIRAAKTKEIEAFSVINEENKYDVHTKINAMLQACVLITYLDGTQGSYLDIQYGDRDILLILIARLTSKNGRRIMKKIKCSCGCETEIDFVPANFKYKTELEKLTKYFDSTTQSYTFKLKNGNIVKLKPPTIGLSESLNTYIIYNTLKAQQDNTTYLPNISFMDTIPYLKSGSGTKELEIKEWEQEEFEYEKMNDELFMFIEDAIKMIDLGIKEVSTECSSKTCNKTVSTPFHYPDGVRSLFIIPNAFDEFIAE